MTAGWGVDRSDAAGGSGAVLSTDHGALSGLSDDDHSQYLLLAGRSGGQVVRGGTAASNSLTLRSTSNATKGSILLADEGGNVILGGGATASEFRFLEPSGSGTNYTAIVAQAQSGNITYTLPAANATNGVLLNDGSGNLSWDTDISDLIDHGTMNGLADDDHAQYALLVGRSGGQTLIGGTAASNSLTLRSTSNATKGTVAIADQGGNVTVGGGATASEFRLLEPSGSGTNYTAIVAQAQSGNITYTLPAANATNGVLLNDGSGNLSWDTDISDLIDHGTTTGLTDDDHTQYMLLAGRSGGQTLTGGTAASNGLTLRSTSNATKGVIALADEGGNVTVGGGATASELRLLEPSGSGTNYTALKAQAQAGNVTYTLPAADGTTGQVLSTNGSGSLSWAAGGGGGASTTVTAASHGFNVGDVLYHTGSAYALADADAAATAEVVGIVSAVPDSNTFTLLHVGEITGLSGLVAGTVYFLSGTAGALTATEPSTVGQISKPLLVAHGSSGGFFFNLRGTVVGSSSSTLSTSEYSGNGSTTAFTLTSSPNENNTFVFISGIFQQRTTYSISGTTLTFSTAPPTGTNNIEVIIVGSVGIGTPSDATVTNAKMVAGALFTAATEQASTSGTSIDFTGIPAGTQMIIVSLEGVSTNGTSDSSIQLGDAGGIENTDYISASVGGAGTVEQSTGSFNFIDGPGATSKWHGLVILLLKDSANFTWSMISIMGGEAAESLRYATGSKSLSAELTQLRISTDSGDTFDAGSINIMYR